MKTLKTDLAQEVPIKSFEIILPAKDFGIEGSYKNSLLMKLYPPPSFKDETI